MEVLPLLYSSTRLSLIVSLAFKHSMRHQTADMPCAVVSFRSESLVAMQVQSGDR